MGRNSFSFYTIMAKKKHIALCILLVIILHFIAIKRTITFNDIPNISSDIIIKIPPVHFIGLFKNFEVHIYDPTTKNYLNLLYSAFDAPLLFMPSNDGNAIFVVYFFDIEQHVFAIELDNSIDNANLDAVHKSIKTIVTSSNGFKVRYLNDSEIEFLINMFKSMPNSQYKSLSIPTIDFGFYKF